LGYQIKKNEGAGHVARVWGVDEFRGVWGGKHEGKRPLEKPRRRWKDNIKTYLREMEWKDVDWIKLSQERDK
jgi:hypothetical protein